MTEKDYNPEQRNAKAMTKPVKTSRKTEKADAPVKKIVETSKEEKRLPYASDKDGEETQKNRLNISPKKEEKNQKPIEDTKEKSVEEQKETTENPKEEVSEKTQDSSAKDVERKKITKPKEKRTEAVVNSHSLPISTKHSVAVCKFIKNKKIETAIADLQQVIVKKKAVPMKGEIPHRKGRIMSGRFPKKAAERFIKVLKTLAANANVNGLNNPVISEAIANLAQRPRGKAGRVKRKRTHVKIVAREKENRKEKKK